MGEKRFKKMDTIIDPFPIWDTVEGKGYNCTDTLDVLVDLLNVMNETLLKQAKENHKLSNENVEQQLSFDCAMKIVNKQKWIQIKDIERLEKFIQNQQATIEAKDSLLSIISKENEQLRTQLLICQQSRKDDGRFQVWEVPPIPKGMRIKISTGEKDE